MKIVYLITGSGGSFYCGNCYRDMLFVRAIRKVPGITSEAIPLYLPPDRKSTGNELDSHVFFGAISMYLREKVHFLSKMPGWLDKVLDTGPMLKLASRFSGTTSTEGLEDLTLNMIEGDNAFRRYEVDRLVKYLTRNGKPDIIHLSNALIIGLARQIKRRLDVKIVCSLLNEDDWIEVMAEPFRTKAWKMIAAEARYIDTFITPSNYYRNLFIQKTGLDGSNIRIVPLGFYSGCTAEKQENPHSPSIGYLCRVNSMNGFDKMVDAFLELKKAKDFKNLSLHVCGGYTGEDKQFIKEQIRKIREQGQSASIKIYPEFDGDAKREFFRNIDIMSVPVRKIDGYGLYILEANCAGVPVVQPATGAFPEILGKTGGGIVYSPDTVSELSVNLSKLLLDRELRTRLSSQGMQGVAENLSPERMSVNLSEIYSNLV
ncbi:MAG: glycosyltransferase family 4 protein [Bacteroidota bacterium]|nr:glycosyltransferase family 4 protein [Bacteroidota bacterium]